MENITKIMRFAKNMIGIIAIITMILGFFWPMGFFYLGTLLAWVTLISLLLYAIGCLIKHYKGFEEDEEDCSFYEELRRKKGEDSDTYSEYEGVYETEDYVEVEESSNEEKESDKLLKEVGQIKGFAKDALDLGDYEAAEKWLEKAEKLSLDAEKKAKEEAEAKRKAEQKAKEEKEKEEKLRARLNKL